MSDSAIPENAAYSAGFPDSVLIRINGKNGEEQIRLLCVRCVGSGREYPRMFATNDGLNDHIVGYHHDKPFDRARLEAQEEELLSDED